MFARGSAIRLLRACAAHGGGRGGASRCAVEHDDDRKAEEEEERGADAPVTKAGDVMGLMERIVKAKSSVFTGGVGFRSDSSIRQMHLFGVFFRNGTKHK